MKATIISILLLDVLFCFAQEYKKISLIELKNKYENADTSFELNGYNLEDNLTELFFEMDTIDKNIHIHECKIESFQLVDNVVGEVHLRGNYFDSLQLINVTSRGIELGDNTFKYGLMMDNSRVTDYLSIVKNVFGANDVLWFNDNLRISNSKFESYLMFISNTIERGSINDNTFSSSVTFSPNGIEQWMSIAKNTFLPIKGTIAFEDPMTNKSIIYKNQFSFLPNGPIAGLSIAGNEFRSDDKFQTAEISGEIGSLFIEENTFETLLILASLSIEKQFNLTANNIQYVSFGDMSFSETSNTITWDDLSEFKLLEALEIDFDEENPELVGIDPDSLDRFFDQSADGDPIAFFEPLTDIKEPLNQSAYDQLVRNYYQLYTIQKQNGNIRSANNIYNEMKEIEGMFLQIKHDANPSFNSFFRWRLNRLMGFYTDHGTNPAKSITISFYIVIGFGIFYFFFPSEWDKESKKSMLMNYKNLVHKDGKYLGPFLLLSKGILISLINGQMLSLNAFVTLGFGRIPTSGLAKYACIFQGFLGWFLLTLFTVTLINQVQF